MDVLFLTLDEVSKIHRVQIDRYGGSHGIRDNGLFQLAVAIPEAGCGGQFLHSDIFEMAAAYAFHIAQNHPFLDGNKRVAAVAAIVFLKLNSVIVVPDEERYESVIREVAEGKAQKLAIAEYLRQQSKY